MKINWEFIIWDFLIPIICIIVVGLAVIIYSRFISNLKLKDPSSNTWQGTAWQPEIGTAISTVAPATLKCYQFMNGRVCQ